MQIGEKQSDTHMMKCPNYRHDTLSSSTQLNGLQVVNNFIYTA
jgi:hypothetical protein